MLRGIAARRAGQRRAHEAAQALGIGSDSGPAGTVPVGRAYRIAEFTPDPVPLPLPRQRRLSWQPSWLLVARHRVVPFTGRIAELAELAASPTAREAMPETLAANMADPVGGVLLVVDYAERWPTADLRNPASTRESPVGRDASRHIPGRNQS